MTENEHIKLVEVGNSFWEGFSRLVAEHLLMMPKERWPETIAYLGDKTSIYSSNFEKYLSEQSK